MPTHEEDSAFLRGFRGLTGEQRQQFFRARDKMVEDLRRVEGGERTWHRSGPSKMFPRAADEAQVSPLSHTLVSSPSKRTRFAVLRGGRRFAVVSGPLCAAILAASCGGPVETVAAPVPQTQDAEAPAATPAADPEDAAAPEGFEPAAPPSGAEESGPTAFEPAEPAEIAETAGAGGDPAGGEPAPDAGEPPEASTPTDVGTAEAEPHEIPDGLDPLDAALWRASQHLDLRASAADGELLSVPNCMREAVVSVLAEDRIQVFVDMVNDRQDQLDVLANATVAEAWEAGLPTDPRDMALPPAAWLTEPERVAVTESLAACAQQTLSDDLAAGVLDPLTDPQAALTQCMSESPQYDDFAASSVEAAMLAEPLVDPTLLLIEACEPVVVALLTAGFVENGLPPSQADCLAPLFVEALRIVMDAAASGSFDQDTLLALASTQARIESDCGLSPQEMERLSQVMDPLQGPPPGLPTAGG